MKHWLFTDFDGTFRNGPNKTIRKEDLGFVRDFQNKGNVVTIATGRDFHSISKYLENVIKFKPDYYVCNTGGIVADGKGNIISSKAILDDTKKQIIKILIEYEDLLKGVIFDTATSEKLLFNRGISDDQIKMFLAPENINEPLNYLNFIDVICFKLICNKETWEKILETIENRNLKVSTVVNNVTGFYVCEIHEYGVNKAYGIKQLQNILGFENEQVIVAGDDSNDVSMLKEYKNSFIVKQIYNNEIRKYASHEIDSLFEIGNYLE